MCSRAPRTAINLEVMALLYDGCRSPSSRKQNYVSDCPPPLLLLTGMALVGDISPVSSRGRAVNAGTACHGTNLYLTIRHRAEKHEC